MLTQKDLDDVCKIEEIASLEELETYVKPLKEDMKKPNVKQNYAEAEARLLASASEWYKKYKTISDRNGMGPCTVGHQAKQTMVGYFKHKGWKFREVVETDFKLECIPPSTFTRLATNLYIPNAKGISVEDRIQILIFAVYKLAKEEGWVDQLNLFM